MDQINENDNKRETSFSRNQNLSSAALVGTLVYTEFYAWGSDKYGQLGLAEFEGGNYITNNSESSGRIQPPRQVTYHTPRSLSFDILIQQLSCGGMHAAFISREGQLFTMGCNSRGQLGVDDRMVQVSSAPLLVDTLPRGQRPQLVKCGIEHTVLITVPGSIFTWGSGQYGQTGRGLKEDTFSPSEAVINVEGVDQAFVDVDCGPHCTVAVNKHGQVFATGENSKVQLGLPCSVPEIATFTPIQRFNQPVIKVACGLRFTLFLTERHNIYAVGDNSTGCLAQGHTYSTEIPLMVHKLRDIKIVDIQAGRHAAALSDTGQLFIWGPALDPSKPLKEPQELRAEKKINQISVGATISALIDESGLTYTWGVSNNYGQLGLGHDKYFQLMPELIPELSDRRIRKISCGQDFVIALGQDCSTGNRIAQQTASKPPKAQNPAPEPKLPPRHERIDDKQLIVHQQPPGMCTPHMRNASQETTQRMIKSSDNLLRRVRPSESDIKSKGTSRTDVDVLQQLVSSLKKENESLIRKNQHLTDKVTSLSTENAYLLKNATDEVTVLTDIMDQHIAKAEEKRSNLSKEYQMKLDRERERNRKNEAKINELVIQLRMRSGRSHNLNRQEIKKDSGYHQKENIMQFDFFNKNRKEQSAPDAKIKYIGSNLPQPDPAAKKTITFGTGEVDAEPVDISEYIKKVKLEKKRRNEASLQNSSNQSSQKILIPRTISMQLKTIQDGKSRTQKKAEDGSTIGLGLRTDTRDTQTIASSRQLSARGSDVAHDVTIPTQHYDEPDSTLHNYTFRKGEKLFSDAKKDYRNVYNNAKSTTCLARVPSISSYGSRVCQPLTEAQQKVSRCNSLNNSNRGESNDRGPKDEEVNTSIAYKHKRLHQLESKIKSIQTRIKKQF